MLARLTLIFIGIFGCVFLLSACDKKHHDPKTVATHIIVAKENTPTKQLFFSGTLAPITTSAVVSPVEGTITAIAFTYGQKIKKGQKLFVIDSKPLEDNYRKVVSDFLSKKQTYATSKVSFEGTSALYKAGVVAKNDFTSAQSQFDNAALAFLQSQYTLEKVLKTAKIDFKKIERLTLSDTKAVNAILERNFSNVNVFAPHSGVALFPLAKSDDSSSGKLTQGATVKEGQLLLSIGHLTGLSATFNVSEVDVNQIKNNMKVIVTGDAFPGKTLYGLVVSVSGQANNSGSNGSGLSMYDVKVDIPTIPADVLEQIRVGMTAKFEIDISSAPRIMLPINAVTQEKGLNVVTILDADGKQKKVPVQTGETTPTQVVIESGIQPGQKVVVND